ncbi:BZIP transcription factor [Phlyctema vagabunda]|uniref:BZIP transcription factor n=1 Tax=Phlyctema vagabunda TaxID=108571 RepID=A0ABR4PLS0_9HELO
MYSASRAGTRSVATLSEAQLVRKRANDREAQRLIRQRTRDHIEQLKNRISELSTGKDDHKEFERLRQRNSELEQEVKLLKDNRSRPEDIGSVAGYVPELIKEEKHISFAGSPPDTISFSTTYNTRQGSITTSPVQTQDALWPSQNSSFKGISSTGTHPGPPIDHGAFSTSYDTYADSSIAGMVATATDPALINPLDPNWIETSSPSRIYHPMRKSMQDPASSPSSQLYTPSFAEPPSVPVWDLPIQCWLSTGTLDSVFIRLVQEQRHKGRNGASSLSIIGPRQPDMKAIAYPQHTTTSHHVSTILSDLLKKTTHRGLPEKAASMFIIYRLCQWQISPSKLTYDALFEWQIPQASQITTPHPIWTTYIAWPDLRDKVIGNQALHSDENFQHIITRNLNINWPWRDIDCFTFGRDGHIQVSEEFERHISVITNWTLDAPFTQS